MLFGCLRHRSGGSLSTLVDCYVVLVPRLGVLCRMEESQHSDSCTYSKWSGGGRYCRHYDGAGPWLLGLLTCS
jgi:hypothetical protein